MTEYIGLWPHQLKAIELVREEYRKGAKWVVLVMATGAGKTRTGGELARAHLAKNPSGKVLWIAHRDELIGQAYDDLTELGLSCGVIQANPCRPSNPFRPVQVASIQTLIARNIVVDDVTLFIYDECHHCMSGTWSEYVLRYKANGVRGVGLTATPIRADGLPLGDIYDAIVSPISMTELIEQGFLTPYELQRPPGPLKPRQIAQRPVDAYLEHAKGRKTIVFAPNIVAGRLFAEDFRNAGISAEIVTGTLDAGSRRRVLEQYKTGEIQVLVNVGVLTEGFDDRPTSCIILARSVGSLTLYLQMCGRGLRNSPETGKTNAILIDLYGSSYKHLEPAAERTYHLEGDGVRSGKSVPLGPEQFCTVCGVTMDPDDASCPECGTAKPGQMAPEVVGVPLVKYAWMRTRRPDQRAKDLRLWLDAARADGHKEGRALHKYRAVYGDWPPPDILQEARRRKQV